MNYRIDDKNYGRYQELVLRESGLYFPEKRRAEFEAALFKALADAPKTVRRIDDYYHYIIVTIIIIIVIISDYQHNNRSYILINLFTLK